MDEQIFAQSIQNSSLLKNEVDTALYLWGKITGFDAEPTSMALRASPRLVAVARHLADTVELRVEEKEESLASYREKIERDARRQLAVALKGEKVTPDMVERAVKANTDLVFEVTALRKVKADSAICRALAAGAEAYVQAAVELAKRGEEKTPREEEELQTCSTSESV